MLSNEWVVNIISGLGVMAVELILALILVPILLFRFQRRQRRLARQRVYVGVANALETVCRHFSTFTRSLEKAEANQERFLEEIDEALPAIREYEFDVSTNLIFFASQLSDKETVALAIFSDNLSSYRARIQYLRDLQSINNQEAHEYFSVLKSMYSRFKEKAPEFDIKLKNEKGYIGWKKGTVGTILRVRAANADRASIYGFEEHVEDGINRFVRALEKQGILIESVESQTKWRRASKYPHLRFDSGSPEDTARLEPGQQEI